MDAIAVTNGPGLMGALLVGDDLRQSPGDLAQQASHRRESSKGTSTPYFSKPMRRERPELPAVCLIVSGGHTVLYHVNSPERLDKIQTERRRWHDHWHWRGIAWRKRREILVRTNRRYARRRRRRSLRQSGQDACARLSGRPRDRPARGARQSQQRSASANRKSKEISSILVSAGSKRRFSITFGGIRELQPEIEARLADAGARGTHRRCLRHVSTRETLDLSPVFSAPWWTIWRTAL